MLRRLLRLLAPPILALALWTPDANAQQPTPPAPQTKAATSDEEKGERSFAFPYAMLLIYTLLVMTIVCTPSRKA